MKIPPPLIGLTGAVIMWLMAKYIPLASFILPAHILMAVIIAIIAVAIDLSAIWSFRQARTTINPLTPDKSSTVVKTGIYAYSRNPMYLGMLLLLIAFAIYLGRLSPWIIPPLFVLIINNRQIVPEETALAQLFSEDYLDYKNTVRRWL